MSISKLKLAKELIKNRSFISKIPDLFRMIKASLRGEYKMNRSNMIYSLLIFIYLVSPLDIIPDFLPIIGVADDLGLLGILISKLMKETDNFLLAEEMKK